MARTDIRSIRRREILDVAERLLTEGGWKGVTFAAICQAGDVSNGVLTYHFKNKNDLLLALFARHVQRVQEEVLAPAFDNDRPLAERLATLIGQMERLNEERREFRILALHYLSSAVERPEFAAEFSERFRALDAGAEDAITARLRHDAAAGIVRRDPEAASAVVLAAFVGLGFLRGAFGIDPSEEEIVDMLYCYLTTAPDDSPSMERRP